MVEAKIAFVGWLVFLYVYIIDVLGLDMVGVYRFLEATLALLARESPSQGHHHGSEKLNRIVFPDLVGLVESHIIGNNVNEKSTQRGVFWSCLHRRKV